MSDQPAATSGCFSDFRLIKGRKVAQIVIEVPIEKADQALAALGGLPQPAEEKWVAVARINGAATNIEHLPPDETYEINQVPQPKKNITYGEFAQVVENAYYKTHPEEVKKPKPPKAETKLSLEAVMRCKDPQFWQFLEVSSEQDAAHRVRRVCQIDSRSGLNTDPVAASLWRGLDAHFLAWKSGEAASLWQSGEVA